MFSSRPVSAALALCCFVSIVSIGSIVRAQTPKKAEDFYNRSVWRQDKGDFDGAISDLSMAIELSSRLDGRKRIPDLKTSADLGGAVNGFNEIRALDPLAALAYAHRGLVHYLQGEYDSAIADCNQA